MAQQGKIRVKNGYKRVIVIAVLLILGAVASAYMFNHYSTEELAKFALIKYLLK